MAVKRYEIRNVWRSMGSVWLVLLLARCDGPGRLSAPEGFTAQAASAFEVVLSWISPSGDQEGFIVERRRAENGFSRIGAAGKDETIYQDSGLECDTFYFYRVYSYEGSRDSPYSNEVQARTEPCPPPLAPTDLRAVSIGDSWVELTWKDNSRNEDGFLIERGDGDGAFASEITAGINETSYLDIGLTCATLYVYQIRAFNRYGFSEYSQAATAATGPCPPSPPNPPSGLTANLLSPGEVFLAWNDESDDEEGFVVERLAAGGDSSPVATVGSGEKEYLDPGLSCNVTYTYRIRAFGENGYSNYSNEVSINTPMCAPAGLLAIAVSTSQICLSWEDRSDNEEGFRIERRIGTGTLWEHWDSVARDVTSYSDTELDPETVHFYRLLAFSGEQISPYSNEVTVSTFLQAEIMNTGIYHSCAGSSRSGVWCWGSNERGQLGNDAVVWSNTPVNVSGSPDEIGLLSSGGYHSCVSSPVKGVTCWGANDLGQLGDGTTDDRHDLVGVSGLTEEIIGLSAGGYHTCVLSSAGGVKCWGENQYGQLGIGSMSGPEICDRIPCRTLPMDVSGLDGGASSVSAGLRHTCALVPGGGIKCWGRNAHGQLGDGTRIDRSVPVDVFGLEAGIQSVSTGYLHTCAVDSGGGVKCWGENGYGQLGDGSTEDRVTPVEVYGLASGMISVTVGYRHTCALSLEGFAYCWGDNVDGQLGDGSYDGSKTPIIVSGLPPDGVTTIKAGYRHTCAFTTSGEVLCWGRNDYGQLGNGTVHKSASPVDVVGPEP